MLLARALALVLLLASFYNAIGSELPLTMAPGGSITIAFPEMPLTFYDLLQKKQDKAQMTLYDSGKAAGAKATLLVEDVGKHDFPVSAYPAVRQWLRRVISE